MKPRVVLLRESFYIRPHTYRYIILTAAYFVLSWGFHLVATAYSLGIAEYHEVCPIKLSQSTFPQSNSDTRTHRYGKVYEARQASEANGEG